MEINVGDWVKRIGRPPWIGQVMRTIAGETLAYQVYWLAHGTSWHERNELLKEPVKDGNTSR